MKRLQILFVCTGNICRSPSADAVFRALIAEKGWESWVSCDSAGLDSYHVGESPDRRSQQTARKRGYEMSDLRARQVHPDDFEVFDYVLAMDEGHLRRLKQRSPERQHPKIRLFMDYATDALETEVPDPYYGGEQGFEHVLNLIEKGCQGLAIHIERNHR